MTFILKYDNRLLVPVRNPLVTVILTVDSSE